MIQKFPLVLIPGRLMGPRACGREFYRHDHTSRRSMGIKVEDSPASLFPKPNKIILKRGEGKKKGGGKEAGELHRWHSDVGAKLEHQVWDMSVSISSS